MTTKAEPSYAQDVKGLKGDDKTLKIADVRLRFCIDSMDRIHREALEDLMFVDGQQWPEDILRQRNDERRPSETVNKIPPTINQVVNDMRQNKPQIKIRPVDSVTDPDTAMVIDGHIRTIMSGPDAKSAIDTASFYQVASGFGYIRVLTRYVDKTSFDQELYIDRVENPFSVYVPIGLINQIDFSDMPYCFVRTRVSKDDFAEMYPDSDMTSYDVAGVGEDYWIDGSFIYVCEYFEKVCEYETLYKMSNGLITKDKEQVDRLVEEGVEIDNKREIETNKIIWRKITRNEILEEEEFPGEYIPIVPVLGQEINVNGEKKWHSLTRNMKAAQRMYNYMFNAFVEVIALAPRAPFIVAQAQMEGFEDIWKTANSKNHAYLPYKPITEAAVLLPPPQRNAPPEAGNSVYQGIMLAVEQMKECSGVFDASLGAKGNETSGKAIVARQRQGDTSNFHFSDNQSQSLKHVARILVGIIPELYDTVRSIRVLGEDMTDKIVEINNMHPDPDNPKALYDMSVGKYDIVIDIGPSYETRRIESAEQLMHIMQANPQAALPVMDLIYRNLDFTYSQEAADRMKAMIQQQMPGVIPSDEQDTQDPKQQIQAMVQDMQKLMQMHQMTAQENGQLKQMIGALQTQLKSKDQELQVKADGQVLKAQSEAHKAEIGLAQTQIQEHSSILQQQMQQQAQQAAAQSAAGFRVNKSQGE